MFQYSSHLEKQKVCTSKAQVKKIIKHKIKCSKVKSEITTRRKTQFSKGHSLLTINTSMEIKEKNRNKDRTIKTGGTQNSSLSVESSLSPI